MTLTWVLLYQRYFQQIYLNTRQLQRVDRIPYAGKHSVSWSLYLFWSLETRKAIWCTVKWLQAPSLRAQWNLQIFLLYNTVLFSIILNGLGFAKSITRSSRCTNSFSKVSIFGNKEEVSFKRERQALIASDRSFLQTFLPCYLTW